MRQGTRNSSSRPAVLKFLDLRDRCIFQGLDVFCDGVDTCFRCHSLLSDYISAFCNFNPITFLPVCFPQGRPDVRDHVSVLLLNTAEAGAELGAKVSTAYLLLGFRQRGGFAEGFHGSEHSHPPIHEVPVQACSTPACTPASLAKPRDSTQPNSSTASDDPVPTFQPGQCYCHNFLPRARATGASVLFTVFISLSRLQSK